MAGNLGCICVHHTFVTWTFGTNLQFHKHMRYDMPRSIKTSPLNIFLLRKRTVILTFRQKNFSKDLSTSVTLMCLGTKANRYKTTKHLYPYWKKKIPLQIKYFLNTDVSVFFLFFFDRSLWLLSFKQQDILLTNRRACISESLSKILLKKWKKKGNLFNNMVKQ